MPANSTIHQILRMRFCLNTFLVSLFLLLCICLAEACLSDSTKVSAAYHNFRFDEKVIANLPVYDSLASSIVEKISLFQQHIDTNSSYQAYRYNPDSFDTDVFNKLPEGAGSQISHYFNQLRNHFIYRFDVFKDSTIKIYIRYTTAEADHLDVEENLSYYPAGYVMQQRTFPARDTILSKHWQYWMRVNQHRLL